MMQPVLGRLAHTMQTSADGTTRSLSLPPRPHFPPPFLRLSGPGWCRDRPSPPSVSWLVGVPWLDARVALPTRDSSLPPVDVLGASSSDNEASDSELRSGDEADTTTIRRLLTLSPSRHCLKLPWPDPCCSSLLSEDAA